VPQARSSGSSSGRSQTKRASASKSSGAKRTTRKSASKSSGATAGATRARASGSSSSAGAKSNGAAAVDPRLEAVAQRVRKLNERIIEESKSAGETTLTAYEKALKAIASSLERGPGKSDVEWISALATTQARFIRDVTEAWTSAARGMLK
jgi:ribonuclease D